MSSVHPPTGPRESELEGEWEIGWAGHQAAQRRRIAALPFSLKLDWLEEAHRLVLQLRRARAGDVLESQTGSNDRSNAGSSNAPNIRPSNELSNESSAGSSEELSEGPSSGDDVTDR